MNALWPLDAYFDRIGYRGPREPVLSVLRGICAAHAESVPFETLDAPEGATPDLDQQSVFTKVVVNRGGGACLELNSLLATALRRLGFTVDVVASEAWRVIERRYTGIPDHMVLLVRHEHRTWLVDMGFATLTAVQPVPLEQRPWRDRGWWFRIRPDGEYNVVELSGVDGAWRPVHRFRDQPRQLAEFERVRDHYLRDNARMRRTLMCARWTRDGRLTLVNDRLLTAGAGVESLEVVSGADRAGAVLGQIFEGHDHLRARALRVWHRLFEHPALTPDRPTTKEETR